MVFSLDLSTLSELVRPRILRTLSIAREKVKRETAEDIRSDRRGPLILLTVQAHILKMRPDSLGRVGRTRSVDLYFPASIGNSWQRVF